MGTAGEGVRRGEGREGEGEGEGGGEGSKVHSLVRPSNLFQFVCVGR